MGTSLVAYGLITRTRTSTDKLLPR